MLACLCRFKALEYILLVSVPRLVVCISTSLAFTMKKGS